MKKVIRVIKVPECGYVVIGNGTYSEEDLVEVSMTNKDDIEQLEKAGYVKEITGEASAFDK